MDLKKMVDIIKAKDTLLRPESARAVLDKTKKRIGSQYSVYSGPLGANITVYDERPNELVVNYKLDGKPVKEIMSQKEAEEFFTVQGSSEKVPLKELLRKSKVATQQQQDVNRMR